MPRRPASAPGGGAYAAQSTPFGTTLTRPSRAQPRKCAASSSETAITAWLRCTQPRSQRRSFHASIRPASRRMRRYFVGKRTTNHILRLPAEYSSLNDEDLVQVLDQFSSYVEDFSASTFKRRFFYLVAILLNRLRISVHALGGRPLRQYLDRNPARHLQLLFTHLWGQVQQYNGSVPAAEVQKVSEQLQAMLVGDFLGGYYHTCQLENRVTASLKELLRRLGLPT